MKFVGYMIDENLKWKSHIQYLCTKVTKMLGILSKLQNTLDIYTAQSLFHLHPYISHKRSYLLLLFYFIHKRYQVQ